jgi:cobalt/nickel transport system permease protein
VHIPDGFFQASACAGAGAVGATGLGVALRRTRALLDDRQIPLAGLVAAFIFGAQMLNFPVAGGTSGHLIGGALAAVFVGPWLAALCMSVVLLVQLLFADGGVTAIGLNVTIMGLVTTLGGWSVFRVFRTLLPRDRMGVVLASAIAAFSSVLFAAVAFTLAYAVGGASEVPIAKLATAMLSVHFFIALGEAVITASTVSMVMKVRPDLIVGAADVQPSLEERTATA